MSKRFDWIDVAKGLGIFLIVYGHVIHTGVLYQWIFAFHVPFFFALAGLTYNYRNETWKFIISKIRSLMIPYWVWGAFSIVCFAILGKYISAGSDASILQNFYGLLYGNSRNGLMKWNNPLWFLPCLFVVMLMVQLVEKGIRKIGGYSV